MTEIIPDHLGGYIPGGDDATYFEELWLWFVDKCGVRSVLDIGCGEGHSTKFFRSLGCYVEAVDGVDTGLEHLKVHDFTKGPYKPERSGYDLGWACEVLEHVDEWALPNLNSTFQACDMLAVTHAFPGQQGHHHVNCRPPDYWVGFFAGIGLRYDLGLTQRARAVASFNEHPLNHFVRSGLMFVRV